MEMDFMEYALAQASAAAERGEVPVGAVVVDPAGSLVAASGNRVEELNDPTAHAEMLAIRKAAGMSGSPRLVGYSLYVTLEPCAMCAQAISLARIKRVYFGASDEKSGAVENGVRLYNDPSCHHIPEVYGGINAAKAKVLLRDFFRVRR